MNLQGRGGEFIKGDELAQEPMAEEDGLTGECGGGRIRCRGRIDAAAHAMELRRGVAVFLGLRCGELEVRSPAALCTVAAMRRRGGKCEEEEEGTIYPAPLFIAGRSNRRTSADLAQHGPDRVRPSDFVA